MKKDRFSQSNDRAAERQRLAEWLAEWELDGLLDEGEQQIPHPAPRRLSGGSASYAQSDVGVGDILLLQPPAIRHPLDRPVYAVLLDDPKPSVGQWLLVPFGPFAVPATPGEWVTGLRAEPLRVLCCWNYRRVSISAVPPHWRVRGLNKGQRLLFAEVIRCLIDDRVLPERQRSRVGPPLLHPGDPRHRYLEEERERVDCQLEPGTGADDLSTDSPSAPYISETPGFDDLERLAAESRTRYGLRGGVYLTTDGACIVAVYPLDAERVKVRIVNRDGTSTAAFDRGYLEAEDGQRSERIETGVAIAAQSMAMQFRSLVDAEGQVRPLKRSR